MKYKFLLILMLFSFIGYGVKYTYDKFTSMSSLVDTLKAANLDLKNQNKKLKAKNKKLDNNSKKLKDKQNKMHKKFRAHRIKSSTLTIKKAQKKLLLVPTKMTPIVGISVIAGETAMDIKDYCDSINEMERLESDLFGEEVVHHDNQICGRDIEAELDRQANDISTFWEKKYNDTCNSLQKNFKEIKKYWLD